MRQEDYWKKHQVRFETLTISEQEILLLLAIGFNSPKIADKLFLSPKTVEQHRKNINQKLEVKTAADVTAFAQAFSLI